MVNDYVTRHKTIKLYIHHEAAEPFYTLAVDWPLDSKASVYELQSHFASSFSKAHPSAKTMDADHVLLLDEDGTALAPAECVAHVIHDGCDLFAERGEAKLAPPQAVAASAPAPAASSSSKPPIDAVYKEMHKALIPYLKAAEEAFKERAYKKAATIYGEMYLTLEKRNLTGPGLPSGLNVIIRKLGEIEVINGRSDSALKWLNKAVKACPTDVESRLLLSDLRV